MESFIRHCIRVSFWLAAAASAGAGAGTRKQFENLIVDLFKQQNVKSVVADFFGEVLRYDPVIEATRDSLSVVVEQMSRDESVHKNLASAGSSAVKRMVFPPLFWGGGGGGRTNNQLLQLLVVLVVLLPLASSITMPPKLTTLVMSQKSQLLILAALMRAQAMERQCQVKRKTIPLMVMIFPMWAKKMA